VPKCALTSKFLASNSLHNHGDQKLLCTYHNTKNFEQIYKNQLFQIYVLAVLLSIPRRITSQNIWTKQLRSNFRKNFVHFLEGIKVRKFGFDISWPFNKHQKNAWFKWESNYVPKLIVQKIDYQGFLLVCSHSKFLSTTTFRNSQKTFFGQMLMFWWQECAVTCCCIYHNFKSCLSLNEKGVRHHQKLVNHIIFKSYLI